MHCFYFPSYAFPARLLRPSPILHFFFSRPYMRLPPLIYYVKIKELALKQPKIQHRAPRFNLTASPPALQGHTIADQQLCPSSHPSQLERELFAPFFFLAHAPRCFPGGGGNPQGCTQRNGKPKNPACMLDPKMWW